MAEQDRHKGAIDTTREEFLFLSINEIIAELSEHQLEEPDLRIDAVPNDAVPADPVRRRARILCLPAHDRADEITASMLSQLVEQKGHVAISFSVGAGNLDEWIRLLDPTENDVICISALPPYAFAPARAFCKRIRERFPKLKVIVCVWGFSGDRSRAMSRFERTPPHRLATSLAGAIADIEELTHSLGVPSPQPWPQ